MKGFDNQALAYILNAIKEDMPTIDTTIATEVITLAMAYDLEYMRQEGIIEDAEYTDVFYDDDDAFDFIIERLSNALPNSEPYTLTDMLESYFEYHDAYMEEIGMLDWQ